MLHSKAVCNSQLVCDLAWWERLCWQTARCSVHRCISWADMPVWTAFPCWTAARRWCQATRGWEVTLPVCWQLVLIRCRGSWAWCRPLSTVLRHFSTVNFLFRRYFYFLSKLIAVWFSSVWQCLPVTVNMFYGNNLIKNRIKRRKLTLLLSEEEYGLSEHVGLVQLAVSLGHVRCQFTYESVERVSAFFLAHIARFAKIAFFNKNRML